MRKLVLLVVVGLVCLVPAEAHAQWLQVDKETSPNSMADKFGWSVSIVRDWALVGDPGDNFDKGSAHVYQRNTLGDWVLVTTLFQPGGNSGDEFGSAVDLYVSGSTCRAIVSAKSDNSFKGTAFIYECGNWASPQSISASDGVLADNFGYSVSISGDRALIGAQGHNGGGVSNAGAAYVFERGSGGVWSEVQKLVAGDPQGAANFGWSVSLVGTRAAVGAPNADGTHGAGYAFDHDGTEFNQVAKLSASNPSVNDKLGWSISRSGNYVIAGAYGEDTGASNSGAAYVFKKDGATWVQDKMLKASDRESADQFGTSVYLRANWAVVGAPSEDEGGWSAGAIYVYERNTCGIWIQRDKIVADDASPNSFLGWSVQAGTRTDTSSWYYRLFLTVIGGAYGEGADGAAYWFEDEIPAFVSPCKERERVGPPAG